MTLLFSQHAGLDLGTLRTHHRASRIEEMEHVLTFLIVGSGKTNTIPNRRPNLNKQCYEKHPRTWCFPGHPPTICLFYRMKNRKSRCLSRHVLQRSCLQWRNGVSAMACCGCPLSFCCPVEVAGAGRVMVGSYGTFNALLLSTEYGSDVSLLGS